MKSFLTFFLEQRIEPIIFILSKWCLKYRKLKAPNGELRAIYLGSSVCFRSKSIDVGLMKFMWPIDLFLGWFCFHLFVVICQTLFKSRFPSCSCWYAFYSWRSKQQSIILDKSRCALKMRAMIPGMITVQKNYFDLESGPKSGFGLFLFFFYRCNITVEFSFVFIFKNMKITREIMLTQIFIAKECSPCSHGSHDKCFESVVLETFRRAVFSSY